jgi:hypothetical protein
VDVLQEDLDSMIKALLIDVEPLKSIIADLVSSMINNARRTGLSDYSSSSGIPTTPTTILGQFDFQGALTTSQNVKTSLSKISRFISPLSPNYSNLHPAEIASECGRRIWVSEKSTFV